ncbi:hypothetical protein [Tabrizicola sp.]|uniref:hypothetical protein n=1 Tax=Tabrizicola sp. TaxID=2005166 RepID=UPI002606D68E|nr:hypothetical protein [Tabrizicola sp.]MDM7932373.1 hypothetical protein [Tabrizicola sp.]
MCRTIVPDNTVCSELSAFLMGYAMNGVPDMLAHAASVLDGGALDIGWPHADAP